MTKNDKSKVIFACKCTSIIFTSKLNKSNNTLYQVSEILRIIIKLQLLQLLLSYKLLRM